jgi:hypothetical protein
MTDEMIALSRRAVACRGWRWMAGMLSHHGERQLWCSETEREWSSPSFSEAAMDWRRARFAGSRELPDLADPATLGCLLALVREAWRCPTVYVRQSTTRRVSDGALAWEVCDLYLDAEACRALGVPREGSVGSWGHGSEAEALVAALESAP